MNRETIRLHSFLAGLVVSCLSMAIAGRASGGNPIVDGKGLADPHAVIYGDRVFLYATHDLSPDNKGFVMTDWWVWSSADLVNWRQEGTLKPEQTYIKKPFKDCWATFGISKNGKYYWYFSAGPNEIGVVTADSPAGPWKDPLGKPLVPKGLTRTEQRDPDILLDDDGKAYMVFGTFDHHIVLLNDDMISLAEKPRLLQMDRKFGPYGEGKTDDKPSLHKRNGIYYLSWSSYYAMSNNVYGPYAYKGTVIDPLTVAPEFRTNNIHHDRHGNFFTWHNQWYYVCNDKSQPGRGEFFRDSCMSYVHYRDNGEMAPIRLDRTGVGQYDAGQGRIEAEDYFDASGAEQRECPAGGFEVRGLHRGSYLVYTKVGRLQRAMRASFRVASGNPQGATLEIREKSATGILLGVCRIPCTGGWGSYQTVECDLQVETPQADLVLVTTGGTGELLRLDWFAFHGK